MTVRLQFRNLLQSWRPLPAAQQLAGPACSLSRWVTIWSALKPRPEIQRQLQRSNSLTYERFVFPLRTDKHKLNLYRLQLKGFLLFFTRATLLIHSVVNSCAQCSKPIGYRLYIFFAKMLSNLQKDLCGLRTSQLPWSNICQLESKGPWRSSLGSVQFWVSGMGFSHQSWWYVALEIWSQL